MEDQNVGTGKSAILSPRGNSIQHRRTQSLSLKIRLRPKALPKNFQEQITLLEKGVIGNKLSKAEITQLLSLYQVYYIYIYIYIERSRIL